MAIKPKKKDPTKGKKVDPKGSSKNPIQLEEVTVTARPIKKKMAPSTTRLYPKGEVENSKVDSIKKANPKLGRLIGSPNKGLGKAQYGASESDLIKKALKRK